MFILLLRYIKQISEVDRELENHIKYLDKYYSLGKFICSGRRNPRIGGVVLLMSNIGGRPPIFFYVLDKLNNQICDFQTKTFHKTQKKVEKCVK
jgi:hypothetical protein